IGGDFHEISLSELSINGRSTSSFDSLNLRQQQQNAIGLNFTYRYGARIHAWGDFQLYLAYRAGIGTSQRAATTEESSTIQYRFTAFSLGIGIEPMIQYSLNDRMSLEWSFPIGLISGSLNRQRMRNLPSSPAWQDEYHTHYRLPQFQAISTRFGLVISL
ncbi:MAG: hypothetical protein AAF399_23855, partial [Bacteroidota bacterium]